MWNIYIYIYIYTSVLLAISIANKTFCVQDVQVHLASTSGQFLMTLHHILQCVRAVLNDATSHLEVRPGSS